MLASTTAITTSTNGIDATNPMLNALNTATNSTAVAAAFSTYGIPTGFPSK